MDDPASASHIHDTSHAKKGSASQRQAARVADAAVALAMARMRKAQAAAEAEEMGKVANSHAPAYPYDRPSSNQAHGSSPSASQAQPSWQAQLKEMAKDAREASQAVQSERAKREAAKVAEESAMMRDMFKAVFPEFKGWGAASKVASWSGSLTLSLAFFGFVYWASTRYDKSASVTTGGSAQAEKSSGSHANSSKP